MDEAGLDPRQRAGRLSGGQRAQLALTLAVARRPELLVLDEPAANLDPLARRDFLDSVTRAVAASGEGMTVVFSSHLVADLERTCGYLILLAGGQVRLAGPVDALLAAHGHARSLDDLVVSYLREVSAMTWLAWRQARAQAADRSGGGPRRHRRRVRRGPGGHHRSGCGCRSSAVVVPGLLGVFWGAPLVAGELESGSFRLAWTQDVSRARWLASRLAVTGLAAMAVAGAGELAGHLVGRAARPRGPGSVRVVRLARTSSRSATPRSPSRWACSSARCCAGRCPRWRRPWPCSPRPASRSACWPARSCFPR